MDPTPNYDRTRKQPVTIGFLTTAPSSGGLSTPIGGIVSRTIETVAEHAGSAGILPAGGRSSP